MTETLESSKGYLQKALAMISKSKILDLTDLISRVSWASATRCLTGSIPISYPISCLAIFSFMRLFLIKREL